MLKEFTYNVPNGPSLRVIYGSYMNGHFCCIPSLNISCDMAEPTDIFYNTEHLSAVLDDTRTVNAICKFIQLVYNSDLAGC